MSPGGGPPSRGRARWSHERQPPRHLGQPVPASARRQPRRLARVGSRGVRRSTRARGPGAGVRRVRHVPLVPRHGARELRRPGDRRAAPAGLRVGEGRPRRTAGRRREPDGLGECVHATARLAADDVPDARRPRLLRGDVLPTHSGRAGPGVPADPGRGARRLDRASARGRRERLGHRDGDPAGRRGGRCHPFRRGRRPVPEPTRASRPSTPSGLSRASCPRQRTPPTVVSAARRSSRARPCSSSSPMRRPTATPEPTGCSTGRCTRSARPS